MQIHNRSLQVPATTAFILLMIFHSCKKDDLHDLNYTAGNIEITALREAVASSTGTSPDKVVFLKSEKRFIVDGDSYVTLQDAQLRFGNQCSEPPGLAHATAQMMSAYSIDTSRVKGIKIFADSTVPDAWITALDLAIGHWNGTGSKVHIQRVAPSYPYTTLVTTKYEVSSSIATAAFPNYYGYPGNKIYINTYHNGLSELKKEFTLTHELGHTLGFNHTNETSGYLIPGTPTSDAASVMNSVCVDWSGFSNYDLVAVRTIYPADTITDPDPDPDPEPEPEPDPEPEPEPTHPGKKGGGKNK